MQPKRTVRQTAKSETNDRRKYLMERNDIVAARLKFLRKMHIIRSSDDTRPTFYLDETTDISKPLYFNKVCFGLRKVCIVATIWNRIHDIVIRARRPRRHVPLTAAARREWPGEHRNWGHNKGVQFYSQMSRATIYIPIINVSAYGENEEPEIT
ncbi:hypothetical protein ANN_03996 [Periplaneta americana]|uniref:Uncharacterized protein n=1 Tax=Periplaneta americana TaxID=6978 RepID=A0ABQ8T9Q5_PERAM|nr:hypothetical protein ANN_03996 [Periplaneta americana]